MGEREVESEGRERKVSAGGRGKERRREDMVELEMDGKDARDNKEKEKK